MFLFSFISPKIISIFLPEIVSIHYNFVKTKYPSSFQLILSNVLPKAYPFSCNIDRSCHRKHVVNNKQLTGCRLVLLALYYKTQASGRLNIIIIPLKHHKLTPFRLLWNQESWVPPSISSTQSYFPLFSQIFHWNLVNNMVELKLL